MSTPFPKEELKNKKVERPRTPVPKKRSLGNMKPVTKRSFGYDNFGGRPSVEGFEVVPAFGMSQSMREPHDQAERKKADKVDRQDYLKRIGITMPGQTDQIYR